MATLLIKEGEVVLKKGSKKEIILPLDVINKTPFKAGALLDIKIKQNSVVLKESSRLKRKSHLDASKKIPKSQRWFWTKEWQKKEREVDKEIKQGKLVGPFDNAKDLIQSLRS